MSCLHARIRTCLIIAGAHCLLAAGCVAPAQKPLTLGVLGGAAAANVAATQSRLALYDDATLRALLLKNVAPGWRAPEHVAGPDAQPPYPSLVDYKAIQTSPDDLNGCLIMLAKTGPATTPQDFPTQAHRLAYYINAYNTCVIRAVLGEYPCQSVYSPSMPAFDYDWYFQVDGKRTNLDTLERLVWQTAGNDVRCLFALCSGAKGSPPLARVPYAPDTLYTALNAQMRDCLEMPQTLTISHEHQQLQLCWRIIKYRSYFMAYYESLFGTAPQTLLNVLMELSGPAGRQRLSGAVGYRIIEVPFDRGLNDLAVRAVTRSSTAAQ